MKELVSGRDSALSKRTSFKMIIFLQRINYGKALKVGAEEIGTEPVFHFKMLFSTGCWDLDKV